MSGTLGLENISRKQQRIAELAAQGPDRVLTTLAHPMDLDWLHEAYRRTRKDGATGVDGQTAAQYEENLEGNLQRLLEQAKSGLYRAPPVRRVYIPKADGSRRPLGIPTLEDKILQRGVVMLLEPIYETDFLDVSYGFRPGRSAHQALETLWQQAMDQKGGWIVEVDIRKFFDNLDHGHLRQILQQRVGDGVVLRLIGKWLKAGVQEEGEVAHPESGTPQGGVVSPLLANIYLHEVLDKWFETVVKPRLKGRSWLIRYADDFVMGFEREEDARRVWEVLPHRFGRYGLVLHPEKTRLLSFHRPSLKGKKETEPKYFDFLGFTHYWGRSQKKTWVIKRKTSRGRLTRALQAVARWLRQHLHDPIKEQWKSLVRKLRGHNGYYGITGNQESLRRFREEVKLLWKRLLGRRSQRGKVTYQRFVDILRRYPLPEAKVMHSIYTIK